MVDWMDGSIYPVSIKDLKLALLPSPASLPRHCRPMEYLSVHGQSPHNPTWDDEGVQPLDIQRSQVLDVASGDPGALHQDIALLLHRLPLGVVHHVHLGDVGGINLGLERGERAVSLRE